MIQSALKPTTLTNGTEHANPIVTKALLELDSSTGLNKALLSLLKSSFFEKKTINWKPVKCELVVNSKLTEEFQQIKSEFEANPEAESEEKYGFIVDSDAAHINEIALNGYSCPENAYNVIGQSKSGVYLCKYPDVNMKYSEAKKWPDNLTLKMIVFKTCYGKQTLALVRKDAKLPAIVATPNFSSHMSVIPPKEKDDIETQFDHSQIYLYELNAQKQATKRPRHCMPYAVITWLKFNDGTEWPQYFDEPGTSNLSILTTDSLQLALSTTEDLYLQTKLKSLLKTQIIQNGNSKTEHNDDVILTNGITNGVHLNGEIQSEESKEVFNTEEEKEVTEGLTNGDDNKTVQSSVPDTTETLIKVEELTEASKIDPVDTLTETTGIDASPTESAVEIPSLNGDNSDNATKPTETAPTTSPLLAIQTVVTSTGPTISPLTHKTTLTPYNKPAYPSAYRGHQPGYAYGSQASSYSPYSSAASLPYHQRLMLQQQQQQQLQLQQLAAMQGMGQMGGQGNPGQMFLVRGPNGIQYLTSGSPQQQQYGGNVQQQHQQQQQFLIAQAQAMQLQQQQQQQSQHQNLIAAQAAAQAQQLAHFQQQQQQTVTTYAAAPTQYKQGVPQQQAQIIYQSAPQPAGQQQQASKPLNSVASNPNQVPTSAQSGQQPQQTQSPKQQPPHAAAQYAAAQYASQQHQQANPAASGAQLSQLQQMQAAAMSGQGGYNLQQQSNGLSAAQQNVLLQQQQQGGSNVASGGGGTAVQQQQQLQLQQQLAMLQQQQHSQQQQQQQNAQLYALQQQQQQQMMAAGIHANGGQQGQMQYGSAGLQLPGGYQLANGGGQLGGLTLEQLTALGGAAPRPRIVNLRHHPYQRN